MSDKTITFIWCCCISCVAILILIKVSYLFYKLDELTCIEKARTQSLDYQFKLFKGCMVKHNNVWIDYDKYIILKQEVLND